MRKIFLGVFILSLFLLLSCDNNSKDNPVSPEQIGVQKSNENLKTGEIKLNQKLAVPGMTDSYYELNGTINYTFDKLPANSSTSTLHPDIILNLNLNGKLVNTDITKNEIWDVSGNSEQDLYVSTEGILILNKTYPIMGRRDGLELVCTFIVTTDGIALNNVKLFFEDNLIN